MTNIIEYAHTMTEAEFNKKYPQEFHAFSLRNNFEEPVRQFIFGKAEKPTIAGLLEKYIYLYNHALKENRAYLTIGFCYALLSKEGNYANGKPIYPTINRNINCNWSFDKLIDEVNINNN